MARYDFSCSTHGPAIVQALLKDKTAAAAFSGCAALDEAKKDEAFGRRLDTHAVTPDDMARYVAPIFESFAHGTDPSAVSTGSPWKYLGWISEHYVAAARGPHPVAAEDLYKVRQDLQDFEAFRAAGGEREALPNDKRDIRRYAGFAELSAMLRPYQQTRDARKARLATVSESILAETKVVYDGPEGKIVIPCTKKSCQFWGMETRWCIAATKSENYFDHYNAKAPIYIYLPAATVAERESFPQLSSFKFAGTDGQFFNELDRRVGYKIPSLERLIDKAQASLPNEAAMSSVTLRAELPGKIRALVGMDKKLQNAEAQKIIRSLATAPGTTEHFQMFSSVSKLASIMPPGTAFWEDPAALKIAMQKVPECLYMATGKIRNNRTFIEDLLKNCKPQSVSTIWSAMDDALHGDADLARLAIIRSDTPYPGVELMAHENFKKDEDLCRLVLSKATEDYHHYALIWHIDEILRDKKDIVLQMFTAKDNLWAKYILSRVSPRLQGDRDVIIAAIESAQSDQVHHVMSVAANPGKTDPAVVAFALKKSDKDHRKDIRAIVARAQREAGRTVGVEEARQTAGISGPFNGVTSGKRGWVAQAKDGVRRALGLPAPT